MFSAHSKGNSARPHAAHRSTVSKADAATAFKREYSTNSGIASRETLFKTRAEAHKMRVMAKIEADHQRYPVGPAIWQDVTVKGAPKIGHHKKGHW